MESIVSVPWFVTLKLGVTVLSQYMIGVGVLILVNTKSFSGRVGSTAGYLGFI